MPKLPPLGDNAFAIIAAYLRQARRAHMPKADIDAIIAEATSKDYYHLRKTLLGK